MNIVIGSGHTGVACAVRLIRSGLPVTMIDGGIQIDNDTDEIVEKMSSLPKANWNSEQLQAIKANVVASSSGLKIKRLFGSDFVFSEVDELVPRDAVNLGHITPSLAVAGFSNVWGAAALPYHRREFSGWPVTAVEMAPHYQAVASYMQITGHSDHLDELFPNYCRNSSCLRVSRQTAKLRASMERHVAAIRRHGFVFGSSRLAVQGSQQHTATGSDYREECTYCGLCLFGCPYGHIYSTNQTLEWLKQQPLFHYRSGFVVDSVHEQNGIVKVNGFDRVTRVPFELEGGRVFLGAGVLSTARILLKSRRLYGEALTLKASEYFIFPLLSLRNTPAVDTEALHTLSQMFIECVSPEIGEHSAHMQLYSYSEHFRLGLRETLKLIRVVLPALEPHILGRLMVIQGYLHSDVSSKIELRLKETQSGDRLDVRGKVNPEAARRIHKLIRLLGKALRPVGVVPLRFMLNVGMPGDGRHVGGTFPMGESASAHGTDLLGRPFGMQRIHIVDASTFPTIPASTISFSAMANADRIALQVANISKTNPNC